MRKHRSEFHTTLPFFVLIGTATVHHPTEGELTGFWLGCKRCKKFFILTPDTLTASTYLTRSCPGCFAASQLPKKLWVFVPEPETQDG